MDHASRYIDYYHKYEFSDRYCIIYYPFKNYLVLRDSARTWETVHRRRYWVLTPQLYLDGNYVTNAIGTVTS